MATDCNGETDFQDLSCVGGGQSLPSEGGGLLCR